MQVDPTLMNVGDGGTVSREISAPNKASASMVGNPPQTLPPEFRGDVTLSQQNKTTPTTDCKTAKACLVTSNYNHIPELSPLEQPNNAPTSSSALSNSEKRADKKAEAPKVKADGAGVLPAPQWSSGVKAGREDPQNPCHSNVTSSKQSHTQTQSAQSVSAGFQSSAMFKPVQPVAFLPSANFSSPLCKITLPPALGQIAALREATAGQFQKETQPQSSGVRETPLMRTYPYPFSVGRTPAAEKKASTSTSKLKSIHSSNKNAKCVGEHNSLASVVASPAIALPLQHPSLTSAAPTCYTLSPTAAICCGSALASITSQSRLLNHVEKGNSVDKAAMGSLKTTSPSASEDHTAEPRDVPLDLSAKSKRPKCINDPPVTAIEPHNNEPNPRDFLTSKRIHSAAYSSAVQYPILPNTHRNGSHQKQVNRPQNHQVAESKPSWGKGSSQDPIKNIPGTYVGVASPILASTLRGKDGKGTFADEFPNFAKQEYISIIDQGEHLASRGKKPSCVMKSNQHASSGKHVKNTSTAITKNCPSKGALTTALSSSANAHIHPKSGPGKATVPYSASAVSPAWQQATHLSHQASSVQGKITQGSPKTRGAAEGSKFQSAHHSPSKPEDEKWERIKSPLSNLASIVKQQALETTENNQASPVPSRKAVESQHTGSQDTQAKQTSTFKYPPYWPVEKRAGVASQGESKDGQMTKRHDKTSATEPLENNTELNTSREGHVGPQAKQASSKPAGQPHLCGGAASTNGNRMESKLAQVLEGDILRKESGTPDRSPSDKLEGMVASILTGQCMVEGDKLEKKTNGTKEESPTKAAATKRKKSSGPKKPTKEKSPAGSTKKTPEKKKKGNESTPAKVSHQKKKKQSAAVQAQSLSAGKLSPQTTELSPRGKISPGKVEPPTHRKPVADSCGSPQRVESPASLSSSAVSSKEADDTESYFPRLRRGRRRADEARLDLWGFATPSPPPPPLPPPPPASLPPTLTPTPPTRRPRGRPRSNPLPERGPHGKGKTGSAEGETPAVKKRRRCRSKKYQTGDYITEKDKLEDGEHLEESHSLRQDNEAPADPQSDQCPSPTPSSPDPPARRPSFTRGGSVCYQEKEGSPECQSDKPSGKRKFKSKHLSDSADQKVKTKRSSLGKRGVSLALDDDGPDVKRAASPPPTPKTLPSSPPSKKGSLGRSSDSESPPKRPIPPEVRRLIVNKNAGETLLQRAARLGYQDVVQYCLEKDIREVNRRDNAGYTALHEASSRGWTQIVQMLLKHGADVNCSAQDGTRPLHDAVASDNLPIVWLLLNHGADPTLATYSGHTPVKLAHSPSMTTFLTEYFTDLEGRKEHDPSLPWDFYSSSLFETDQEPCWDFLLSEQNQDLEEDTTGKTEADSDKDCLLFEFSSEPLLPCYHVQVSLTQGFCNWFLLTDVLKRLKMSARIFRARYPHLEVVSLSRAELWKQVSVSQVSSALASPYKGKNKEEEEEEEEEVQQQQEEEDEEEEGKGLVDLVRCVPELQRLLGSSIHILREDEEEEEEEEEEEIVTKPGKPRSR